MITVPQIRKIRTSMNVQVPVINLSKKKKNEARLFLPKEVFKNKKPGGIKGPYTNGAFKIRTKNTRNRKLFVKLEFKKAKGPKVFLS